MGSMRDRDTSAGQTRDLDGCIRVAADDLRFQATHTVVMHTLCGLFTGVAGAAMIAASTQSSTLVLLACVAPVAGWVGFVLGRDRGRQHELAALLALHRLQTAARDAR